MGRGGHFEKNHSRFSFPFYAPPQKVAPQKVAGYYVIPSELLSVCLSVRPSVRPSVSLWAGGWLRKNANIRFPPQKIGCIVIFPGMRGRGWGSIYCRAKFHGAGVTLKKIIAVFLFLFMPRHKKWRHKKWRDIMLYPPNF